MFQRGWLALGGPLSTGVASRVKWNSISEIIMFNEASTETVYLKLLWNQSRPTGSFLHVQCFPCPQACAAVCSIKSPMAPLLAICYTLSYEVWSSKDGRKAVGTASVDCVV